VAHIERSFPAPGTLEAVAWAARYAAFRVARSTPLVRDPGAFTPPTLSPPPPPRLEWCDRGDAGKLTERFVRATAQRARAQGDELAGEFRVLHLNGEVARHGPYLWARCGPDRWALCRVSLWPQREGCGLCCGDMLDALCGRLGVVDLVEGGERVAARADRLLGENGYVGLCACTAW
jgi:hypothetical protein